MKYLGITGVDMARKLSTFRSDDRKRAPKTISRWISGKASIDAGVMAWIDQSVRIKAYMKWTNGWGPLHCHKCSKSAHIFQSPIHCEE